MHKRERFLVVDDAVVFRFRSDRAVVSDALVDDLTTVARRLIADLRPPVHEPGDTMDPKWIVALEIDESKPETAFVAVLETRPLRIGAAAKGVGAHPSEALADLIHRAHQINLPWRKPEEPAITVSVGLSARAVHDAAVRFAATPSRSASSRTPAAPDDDTWTTDQRELIESQDRAISVEGPVGCGKTTALVRLAARLAGQGLSVYYVVDTVGRWMDSIRPLLARERYYGNGIRGWPANVPHDPVTYCDVVIIDNAEHVDPGFSESLSGMEVRTGSATLVARRRLIVAGTERFSTSTDMPRWAESMNAALSFWRSMIWSRLRNPYRTPSVSDLVVFEHGRLRCVLDVAEGMALSQLRGPRSEFIEASRQAFACWVDAGASGIHPKWWSLSPIDPPTRLAITTDAEGKASLSVADRTVDLPERTPVRTVAHQPRLTPTELAELGRKPLRAGDPIPWED